MFSVRRRVYALGFSVVVGLSLIGCTLFYPRFDNPLNPDIAYSNTGDVVDSVKCAVTKFYIDRASQLRQEAVDKLREAAERFRKAKAERSRQPQAGKVEGYNNKFCPGKSYWEDATWRIVIRQPTEECTPRECNCEWELLEDTLSPGEVSARIREAKKCKKKPFGLYKYVRYDEGKGGSCVANGGCKPGTRRLLPKEDAEDGFIIGNPKDRNATAKCLLDDNSRFALDPQGKAKIELNLQAVNSGAMSYTKIDASKWGFLNHIILAGDSAKGIPFPSLKATDKKTNKVEITLQMPQADSVVEDIPDPDNEADKKVLKRLEDLNELAKMVPAISGESGSAGQGFQTDKKGPRTVPSRAKLDEIHKERIDQEVRDKAALELTAGAGAYKDCGFLKINFLALSEYIGKVITDQESTVHKGRQGGGLETGLDSIVLTSQFQITLDATAGTQHLLRIVPVLTPPVLGLTPDHTHSLKMTFQGKKGRAFASNTKSLVQKCMDRFKGVEEEVVVKGDESPRKKDAVRDFCSSASTVLVETLIEAVEANKSSGSSN